VQFQCKQKHTNCPYWHQQFIAGVLNCLH